MSSIHPVQELLDTLPLGVVVLDRGLTVRFWNRVLEDWTGIAREQIVGQPVAGFFPHLAGERYAGRMRPLLDGGPPVLFSPQLHPHLIPSQRPDGQQRIQQTTVTFVESAGEPCLLVAVQEVTDLVLTARESRRLHQQALQEIEQRKAAESALLESSQRIRAIVDNAVEAIIVIDTECRVEEFNHAAERLFQYEAAEVVGNNVAILMPEPYHTEHDGYVQRFVATGEARIIGVGREVSGRRKNGEIFPMRLAVSETQIGGKRLFTGMLHDITAQKQLEEQLRTQASRDGLTGIANRRAFDEAFEREWRRAARQQEPLTLILLDIDFFKRYNDTYGHQQGDVCLKAVAWAVAAAVRRPADLAARYGGEEFVVLLPATRVEDALAVAEKIRSNVTDLALPHAASEAATHVSVSLGVAGWVPAADGDPLVLLQQADQALYAAKAGGRNRCERAD